MTLAVANLMGNYRVLLVSAQIAKLRTDVDAFPPEQTGGTRNDRFRSLDNLNHRDMDPRLISVTVPALTLTFTRNVRVVAVATVAVL